MALDYLAFERIILLIKDTLIDGKIVKMRNFYSWLEKIIKIIIY